jgi:hypothetical protein
VLYLLVHNAVQSTHVSEEYKQPLLIARFMLFSCFAYSSTLKVEAMCSSETSLEFRQTTRSSIRQERVFQSQSFPHNLTLPSGLFPRDLFVRILCLFLVSSIQLILIFCMLLPEKQAKNVIILS